jgi:predicted dehydrogenase
MRILIVGFGSIGRRHFQNLLHLGESDLVFLRSNRSTLPDDEIADYPVETDLEAALAHRPEGVIIANPTSLHLDVAIPAAEAGCHLLIEKPISNSMERLGEFGSAVEKSGSKVLVGFQFRYHPQLRKIAKMLAGSEIGRPVSVRAHWGEYLPGWHPWEDYRKGYSAREELGGGVVLTLCHPLDYLSWLIGEVDEVWAFTSQIRELGIKVESNAEIGLRFKNGVLGTVHLDYIQRPNKHLLEIIGTQGTVCWDYTDGRLELIQAGANDHQSFSLPEGYERNDMFLDQTRHFLAVVRGEMDPVCSLADGFQAQKLAEAVLESDRSHRIVRVNRSSPFE